MNSDTIDRLPPESVSGRMDDAFYRFVLEVFPLLGCEEGRESFLQHLERLAQWASTMPRTLTPDKPWSREEFAAALAGPEAMRDPRFGAYMDAFYEEYTGNPEDRMQAFYDDLFHSEQEISWVDWPAVWESVRASYENRLKNEFEEDEWLKGEQSPDK